MPMNPRVVGYRTDPVTLSWTSKDCLLYALGIGAGSTDPVNDELEFTTENSEGVAQRVLPSFAIAVVHDAATDAFRVAGDFDWGALVHGEQVLTLNAPLEVEGSVTATTTITGIYDKGSGAVITTRTEAIDARTDSVWWQTASAAFVRGEGGWGGDRGPSSPTVVPVREADHVVSLPTRRDQALLYRLSGDRNPLHADPRFASRAGFDRPILHGLCTFGFAARSLLRTLCELDPDRVRSVAARFSKPVFPGQELAVSIWLIADGEACFRVATTDGIVMDSGVFTFSSPQL